MPGAAEVWSRGGDHDQFMGRWSRHVAERFIAWLAPGPRLRWLDVGSGTGALSAAIVSFADPSGVVGVDTSAGHVGRCSATS